MQAYREPITARTLTWNLYKSSGISGFYSGSVPNMLRMASKQLYRWPLMMSLPPLYQRLLIPSGKTASPSERVLLKSLSGFTLACLEVLVLCPLERLKVWLMTKDQGTSLRTHFRGDTSLMGALYQGAGVLLVKQIVSWVSFLFLDEVGKAALRVQNGKDELSFWDLQLVSVWVALGCTALTYPIDLVKTRVQESQG